MKNERIFLAIGQISDDKIVEADTYIQEIRSIKSRWLRWGTAAACFIIAVTILSLILLRSFDKNYSRSSHTPTGGGGTGTSYITELFNIDGTVWCFRDDRGSSGAGVLCSIDSEGNETARHTFPTYISPVYGKARKLFYYIDGDTLCSYDPRDDAITPITQIGDNGYFVNAVTDNYVLIINYDKDKQPVFRQNTVANLITNEVSMASGIDWGTHPILDTFGDKVILWEDFSKSVNIYDCVADSSIELYKKEQSSTDIISSGSIFNNSLFFVEGAPYGMLKVIEDFGSDANFDAGSGNAMNSKRVDEANHNIIDIAGTDNYLICAVRDGSVNSQSEISFYCLYADGRFTHFATWEGAHYYNLGSFRMAVTDGLLAACLTTQEDIFTFELQD